MTKKLLVLVPDYISVLLDKGEFQPGYYNPADYFDHVDVVLTNNDRPTLATLQYTVGRASLAVHNVPAAPTSLLRTLGLQPYFFTTWAKEVASYIATLSPHLVRCYGHSPIVYAAYYAKQLYHIPYIVSLHGNPDIDYLRGRLGDTWIKRYIGHQLEPIERIGIAHADYVIPVYSPIISYLKRIGAPHYGIIYNLLSKNYSPRQDYALNPNDVKLLTVSRQVAGEKDPTVLLEAITLLPHTHLTLVGRGNLHESLRTQAQALGIADRVTFIPTMSNEKVIEAMQQADIYVYPSYNYEISKSCMEAALNGVPTIANLRPEGTAIELLEGGFITVENTAEGFRTAIQALIADEEKRKSCGQKMAAYAAASWSPAATEAKYCELYQQLLGTD